MQTPGAKTAQIIPDTLNDIIRERRDEVELRLSSSKEIDPLVGKIELPLQIKDEMENWRLISLVDRKNGDASILLVGDSKLEHRPRITSSITAIDFEQGVAFTKNHSAYKLGNRGHGEPPPADLRCICAAMHEWGTGISFGVPRFFY